MFHQQRCLLASLALVLIIWLQIAKLGSCDDNQREIFRKSAKEVFEIRGFNATDLYFVTRDGYILNVVRATNPLINGGRRGLADRVPLLFVHGFLSNAQGFLINAKGAWPKDYSRVNVKMMSGGQLRRFLKDDPNAKSLPFLALNFGHEVYMLNRRGTLASLGHVKYNSTMEVDTNKLSNLESQLHEIHSKYGNGTIEQVFKRMMEPLKNLTALARTIDLEYWNYSYDEQAVYDIPEVAKLVLKFSHQKQLAYIGHSAGGALAYMALTLNKNFNRQVKKTLLWAPALNLGNNPNAIEMLATAIGLKQFNAIIGPVIPPIFVPIIQNLLAILCSSKAAQVTICQAFYAIIFGSAGWNQELIGAADMGAFMDSVSSHELDHLLQLSASGSKSYHFNYRKAGNRAIYGQDFPPMIDFSKITTNSLSIWYGEHDSLVSPSDVRAGLDDLRVSYKQNFISSPKEKLFFNHGSFLLHKQIDDWLVIPSYYEITH